MEKDLLDNEIIDPAKQAGEPEGQTPADVNEGQNGTQTPLVTPPEEPLETLFTEPKLEVSPYDALRKSLGIDLTDEEIQSTLGTKENNEDVIDKDTVKNMISEAVKEATKEVTEIKTKLALDEERNKFQEKIYSYIPNITEEQKILLNEKTKHLPMEKEFLPSYKDAIDIVKKIKPNSVANKDIGKSSQTEDQDTSNKTLTKIQQEQDNKITELLKAQGL